MVFGQPHKERLQLNDVTVWSHGPNPDADRKDAYKSLPELRRLIREGKYVDAERFANSRFNGPAPYNASYQTLGDLTFDFTLPAGDVSHYQRSLDIGQAIAAVRFTTGGVKFSREIFSSAPDQGLVQKLSADRSGMIGFTMRLGRVERAETRFVAPDTLVMTGNTGEHLSYEVHAKVLHKGGRISEAADGQLKLEAADEAVIILTAATSFVLDYAAGYRGGDLVLAARNLQSAAAKSYETLKRDHIADYRRYFDRVKLDLGPADTATPTDQRLTSYSRKRDPSFAALFYQFGRYLLICSSRPENPLRPTRRASGVMGSICPGSAITRRTSTTR
jgi:alpha-L-fucosidase 2